MNEVIDPVTGMPIPANPSQQAAQQPINVGMPGSTPVPTGVAQNMQQPVQTGQRMLNPIPPIMRKSNDPDKPKKEVSAVVDAANKVTRGIVDVATYPIQKAAGLETFPASKAWNKHVKSKEQPRHQSGFNPNQEG